MIAVYLPMEIQTRYTLLVHVTRLGVPDSSTTTDRVIRVVDGR